MPEFATTQQLSELSDRIGVVENALRDPENSSLIDEAKVLSFIEDMIKGQPAARVSYQFRRAGKKFPILLKLLDFFTDKEKLIVDQQRELEKLRADVSSTQESYQRNHNQWEKISASQLEEIAKLNASCDQLRFSLSKAKVKAAKKKPKTKAKTKAKK